MVSFLKIISHWYKDNPNKVIIQNTENIGYLIDAQKCQVDYKTNNFGPTLFIAVLVQFQSGHFGIFGKLSNLLNCFYD